MNKILFTIALGGLFTTSHLKAQVVLEALEGGIPFTPSAKCLERVYDKHYGDGVHNYIYCAVQGPNGKKWLNLNLGAEYAKESSPHFNPEAVPTDYNDWKAFGNLYQWGRDSDGHEQVEYRQGSENWEFRPINGVRTTLVGPGETSNQMVSVSTSNYYASDDPGKTWLRDPCPEGYRVMQREDVFALVDISSLSGGFSTPNIIVWAIFLPDLYIVTAPASDKAVHPGWNLSMARLNHIHNMGGSSNLWLGEHLNNFAYLYEHGPNRKKWEPIHDMQQGFPVFDVGATYWGERYDYIIGNEPRSQPSARAVRCVQK